MRDPIANHRFTCDSVGNQYERITYRCIDKEFIATRNKRPNGSRDEGAFRPVATKANK
jgi:hypothetical protein